MALWVDKHRPRDLSKLDYHKDQAEQLKNLSKEGDFPHLIDFKVIVLSEVDELTKDAQHALRRTMEKYIATCRIILSVNSTSRVIPAIRSRCLGIRVAAPTEDEIVSVLQYTCKKESLSIPDGLAKRIAHQSDRNLRRAILMLEACKVQQYPFTVNQEITELDWQMYLRETANQILMHNGSKHIFHLEAFVAQFMNIYKKYLSDMVMDEF
uniref:Replication factor C C-terminal domain-containing protein n=1 Tax=Megaselia scalaris TaxID=36166 RepID=T1GZC7_MEGSC